MKYNILPVPAPRMTRRDKWLTPPRPCVARYRAFKDYVRLNKVDVPDAAKIIFYIPMPQSWSKKKKAQMEGAGHTQTPDLDNLVKALLDAVYDNDAHIHSLYLEKRWSVMPAIEITPLRGSIVDEVV